MHSLIAAGFHFTDLFHPLRFWGYQLWSGIGSDLGEITLIGLAWGAWHHVNCQAPWCLRLGRHRTADGHHKLCRKHHPDLPDHKLSLEEIHQRHYDVQDNTPSSPNG